MVNYTVRAWEKEIIHNVLKISISNSIYSFTSAAPHWCMCLRWAPLIIQSKLAIAVAKGLVEFINGVLKSTTISHL